ncbi:MAG: type II toxin-antitoxin system prevent-host-death family antitoxin [Patescibacteria group bacterium]
MITNPYNIIPITKVRSKLGYLAEKVAKDNYIILTKDGSPKAALVDISYLDNLERQVRKAFGKTFIDPKLLKYTREFTDSEIREWEKEDTL